MKKKVEKVLALFLCAVLVLSVRVDLVRAAGSSTETVRIDVTYGQTEARTMLDMVNDFRTGSDAWAWNESDTEKVVYSGLEKLVYDYELEEAAMQRAAEIALSYSHTRPNGTGCETLVSNCYAYGENIAAGYSSAADVFEAWQENDESYDGQAHRRNMLDSDFTAIGIGHVYFNGTHYWVQEFRNPASDQAATEANDSETTVSVEVLLSDADVSVSADPSSLTVACGKSQDLPVLNTTVQMKDAWPSKASEVSVDYTWTVEDEKYALISGDVVTGVEEGTTALITSALGQQVSVPLTVSAIPFTDVDEDDWYYPYVKRMYEEGYMSGTSETTFSPEKVLTREEYVAVLARIEKADMSAYENADTGFTDVPAGEWYSPYVAWAHDTGVASGYTDGSFGLGNPVTREEMAVFVQRYVTQFGYTLKDAEDPADPFTDAEDISEWAVDAVEAMRVAGILHGYDDGSFRPANSTIRGEAAAVFCNILDALN